MRLVCRECSAAYEAPESLFGPQPREVRCNRCGYQWTVVRPASPSDTSAAPAPMPMPVPIPTTLAQPDVAANPPATPPAMPAMPAPAVAPTAAVMLPPDTARLADTLAPPPASPPAPAAAQAAEPIGSTRALLADLEPAFDETDRPDSEERRLSHELSFGETEYYPAARKHRSTRGRIWLILLIVIVIIIAAILFKPQLVNAIPALDGLYAAVGL
ncbi:zinc-ribbon domain-containing protein [Acidisoma cellulosilytica]|uniref:Zinc-ribbon domain-containing protein n=1 Tax=Acidisoma cellulosilyticum TaxID=2802395 RepID=A0A963Z0Z0_9PROT|nr:zinc-ribbon domain-containing protein [Acidisoma cellulosilyticum]MCB8880867.1 zinc-ribbon domain-containing protein [Acidisoma cellulosilyticum]